MADYTKMKDADFDRILGDILQEEGQNLLTVPGVYEAVSEHFNNDVLDRWTKEQGGLVHEKLSHKLR